MTENKRFQVHKVIGSFHEWSIEDTDDDKIVFGSIMHKYEANRLCECLNGLADENKELKDGVEELNEICKYYEMRIKELNNQADAVRTELQLCEEENNALQERNDRQAETIRKLYTLIENKDWKGLTAHIEELNKAEEQLRKEWRTYSEQ